MKVFEYWEEGWFIIYLIDICNINDLNFSFATYNDFMITLKMLQESTCNKDSKLSIAQVF